jgi:hypothetical protein
MSFWASPEKPNTRFHPKSVVGYTRLSPKEIEIRLTYRRTSLWVGHPKRIDHLEQKVQRMIAINERVAAKKTKRKPVKKK